MSGIRVVGGTKGGILWHFNSEEWGLAHSQLDFLTFQLGKKFFPVGFHRQKPFGRGMAEPLRGQWTYTLFRGIRTSLVPASKLLLGCSQTASCHTHACLLSMATLRVKLWWSEESAWVIAFCWTLCLEYFWGTAKQKSRISCKIALSCPHSIVVSGKKITKSEKMKKNSVFVIDFKRFLPQNGRKMLNC